MALHLLPAIKDQQARDRIAKTMAGAVRRIQPLSEHLRLQAIHHDVTDDNVVSRPDASGRPMPDGVIDFGDLIRGWVAADLAVTCSALLHHADGDPFFILPAIRAYHAVHPLTEPELRGAMAADRGAGLHSRRQQRQQQLGIDPDNAYVLGNIEHERTIFEVAASVLFALMEQAILVAAGMATEPAALPKMGPLLPGVGAEAIRLLPLDQDSPRISRRIISCNAAWISSFWSRRRGKPASPPLATANTG